MFYLSLLFVVHVNFCMFCHVQWASHNPLSLLNNLSSSNERKLSLVVMHRKINSPQTHKYRGSVTSNTRSEIGV